MTRLNPGPALMQHCPEEVCATVTRGTGRRGWWSRADKGPTLISRLLCPPLGTRGRRQARPVLQASLWHFRSLSPEFQRRKPALSSSTLSEGCGPILSSQLPGLGHRGVLSLVRILRPFAISLELCGACQKIKIPALSSKPSCFWLRLIGICSRWINCLRPCLSLMSLVQRKATSPHSWLSGPTVQLPSWDSPWKHGVCTRRSQGAPTPQCTPK